MFARNAEGVEGAHNVEDVDGIEDVKDGDGVEALKMGVEGVEGVKGIEGVEGGEDVEMLALSADLELSWARCEPTRTPDVSWRCRDPSISRTAS